MATRRKNAVAVAQLPRLLVIQVTASAIHAEAKAKRVLEGIIQSHHIGGAGDVKFEREVQPIDKGRGWIGFLGMFFPRIT